MRSIYSSGHARNCQAVSRRKFFRIGTLGGLSLAGLLAARCRAAEAGSALRDKSDVGWSSARATCVRRAGHG